LLSEIESLKGRSFGQFSSSKTQRPDTTDPVEIELTDQEDMFGAEHSIDFIQGDIEIKKTGMYFIIAGPQIGKLKGNDARFIDFWLRVNNVDLPNSNVRAVVKDACQKDVIVLQVLTRLNDGDTLNIMMSTETSDEGVGIEAIKPPGEPLIPSIILTMIQM
jgi:hypothetical protein